MRSIKTIIFMTLSFALGVVLANEPLAVMFTIGFVLTSSFGVIFRKHRPVLSKADGLLVLFCLGIILAHIFNIQINLGNRPASTDYHGFILGGAIGIGGALGYLLTIDKFTDYVPSEPIVYDEILQAGDIFSGVLDDEKGVSPELIKKTEARLKIKFPDALLKLYQIQNGGYLHDKLLFKDNENLQCFWQEPMLPMEQWVSAYEHFQIYNDPDVPNYSDWFIPETSKMVIFFRDHQDIFFLDYNLNGPPRIGYAMEHGSTGWYEKTIWWATTQEFLNSFRRFEDNDVE